MGAWGYEPMDDDLALGWLADRVEAPLLAAIRGTLQAYLDQTEKDDVKTIEAIAAAATARRWRRIYFLVRYAVVCRCAATGSLRKCR